MTAATSARADLTLCNRTSYRMQAAQNLLRRFWFETRTIDPLPAEALNVFAIAAIAATEA